jgi:hypothetical protein
VVEDGPPAELASSGADYPRMLAAARLVDGI